MAASPYFHGEVALQFSRKSNLVGSCTRSSGLEGLAHVADKELPDF